jgi:thiol-disulfide isomerase/thioredoxin
MLSRKTWLVGLSVAFILALGCGYKLFTSKARTPEVPVRATTPARPRLDRSVPELSAAINKPLPEARLVGIEGTTLPDESLRKGKVVLLFVNTTCGPCLTEANFIRTVINKRTDIRFYGVATIGNKDATLKEAEGMFPFKTFYDEDALLSQNLGVKRLPIKMFLEDGVVKETWGGASKSEEIQADFIGWIENVK